MFDMNEVQAERLLDVQQTLISQIALGTSQKECLERIASEIEYLIALPDVFCSILILEGSCLKSGAAPSLDADYCAAIEGVKIGPNVGSCGTAAFKKKSVYVSSISTDPPLDGLQRASLEGWPARLLVCAHYCKLWRCSGDLCSVLWP
ncbi:hypothetical protein A3760_08750 [Oleiphilus sp. HI0122]|nr:hypothetical protein A3760_08750 [Oleiphilus sp. HI0122]